MIIRRVKLSVERTELVNLFGKPTNQRRLGDLSRPSIKPYEVHKYFYRVLELDDFGCHKEALFESTHTILERPAWRSEEAELKLRDPSEEFLIQIC